MPGAGQADHWGADMIPERVAAVLAAHGLSAIEFDDGTTPTAPLAALALGVEVGQIAKSLLFRGKDGLFAMVVCPGDRRVSNGKLKTALGKKTRMATADETRQVTGLEPGGVCPFGVDSVLILVDEHLAAWPTIYPAAGTDGSGVAIDFQTLCRITGARVADVTDPAA